MSSENSEVQQQEVQKDLLEQVGITDQDEKTEIAGSLLAMAQTEHEQDTFDVDDSMIPPLEDDDEDENKFLEQHEDVQAPFTPPLMNDSQDDSPYDESLTEEEMQRIANEASSDDGGDISGNDSSQSAQPELSDDQSMMQQGGAGVALALGIGGFVGAVKKMVSGDPQKAKLKALDQYQAQRQALDKHMEDAEFNMKALNESNTGLIRRSFTDQDISPPVEAMKGSFANDQAAQMAWDNTQSSLHEIETSVSKLQKLAVQAGIDPELVESQLGGQVEQFADQARDNLEGFVDQKGTSLQGKLDQFVERVKDILHKFVESLRGLFGQSNEQGMSHS